MKKSLAIASVCMLLLFAASALLYSTLFSESQSKQRDARVVVPKPVVPEKKTDVVAVEPVEKFLVKSVEGTVERRGHDGDWRPLELGDNVLVNDFIRTSTSANVAVQLGKAAELFLTEDSSLVVEGESGLTARVRLNYGHAKVKSIRGGGLRMKFDGSDAEAVTSDIASFSAQNTDGYVVVASDDGVVQLSAAGETVEVQSGQQSIVRPKAAPGIPQKVPTSLFLKVRRPPSVTRRRNVMISGTTTPGANVMIEGSSTVAGERGTFVLEVPLHEGNNRLLVKATDVLGRSSNRTLPKVVVDSKAPKVKGDVDW